MKNEMSYDRACEILGLTTPKSLAENARLATIAQSTFAARIPLRYLVAADIIIEAAK